MSTANGGGVPRQYDNGDPETDADKAAFAEMARVAPFKRAWPEWTWSSPDEDTYIGDVFGETWKCQRERGGDFRAHSSLVGGSCYHADAFQAMSALMAYGKPEGKPTAEPVPVQETDNGWRERIEPFRRAWPHPGWQWSSPNADYYEGRNRDGVTVTCKAMNYCDGNLVVSTFVAEGPSGTCHDYTPFAAMRGLLGVRPVDGMPVAAEPRKDFTTKPRITLIPAHVLSAHILPVLHDGAKKHGRDHWRKCTPREYVEAAVTHALAFLDGDEIDESGHHALAHAAADIILALGTLKEGTNGTH